MNIEKQNFYKNESLEIEESINQEFQFGPTENRRCKDIIFIFIFGLFWFFLGQVGMEAISKGDPKRLTQPFDHDGNQCGYGLAENYHYLQFLNPSSLGSSSYACVKKCFFNENDEPDCLINSKVNDCKNLEKYQSINFLSICLPIDTEQSKKLQDVFQISSLEKGVRDIKASLNLILVMVFISLIISFGYAQGILDKEQEVENMRILGYFLLGISLIYAFIIIFTLSKIREAICIVKAAAQFTKEVSNSIMIPIFFSFFLISFFIIWVTISLYIFSCGEIRKNNSVTPFGSVEWNKDIRNYLLLYLLGFFWNCELAVGLCQLIISSISSMWYFNHHPMAKNGVKQFNNNPIITSFCRAFSYHLGSVIFGSMLIAIMETLQAILDQLYSSMKKQLNEDNQIAGCAFKCLKCFTNCFEQFVKFVTQNSYILIAISGQSFCESSKQAFYLTLNNMNDFSMIQGLGKLFQFFGKICIASSTSLLAYGVITTSSQYFEQIYSPIGPILVIFVSSYIVASLFMVVFGMAGDTFMICLALDKQVNNGKPKSVPPYLQQFQSQYM